MTDTDLPDGLDDRHQPRADALSHRLSWVSLAVLGAFMLLALSGLLGGGPRPVRAATGEAARLEVRMPATIRNGEFFETEIVVTPRTAITDLVIGVTPSLWRDLTVNTFIPAASEEVFENGAFRFRYGAREAGKPLTIKIDSQINPSLFRGTAGAIFVADGDRELARVPLTMRVLP